MSDTKVFSFGEQNGGFGGNGIAAMLPALLQNRGIDTAALMGIMVTRLIEPGSFESDG